jgi:hypothetical protein
MVGSDLPKATAGHELMHVAQYLCDRRNRLSSSLSGGGWVWMDDACATWFEKKMVTAPSYIPSTVDTNIAFVQEPLATDNNQHGYGASMFITYMAQKQGDTVVGDISKLKWDNYQPIDAVKSASSSPIAVDWQLFLESYMKLAVYGAGTSPSSGQVMSLQSGGYVFDYGSESWGTTLTWAGAPDLSARVYRLQFASFTFWSATDELIITFSGNDPDLAPVDAAYIVGSYANSTWKFCGASTAHTFAVKDLKAVSDAGGAVYVMVVNGSANSPYTSGRAEPLNLKVERKENMLDRLHKCMQLDISSVGHATLTDDNPPRTVSYNCLWNFTTLHWDGASFYTDHEIGNPGEDYYVEGTVDIENKTVSLDYSLHYVSPSNGTYYDTTLSFTDFPIHNSEDEAWPYQYYPRVTNHVYGPDGAQYMTITDSGWIDVPNPGVDYAFQYTDFTWPDPSTTQGDWVGVRFWNGAI